MKMLRGETKRSEVKRLRFECQTERGDGWQEVALLANKQTETF